MERIIWIGLNIALSLVVVTSAYAGYENSDCEMTLRSNFFSSIEAQYFYASVERRTIYISVPITLTDANRLSALSIRYKLRDEQTLDLFEIYSAHLKETPLINEFKRDHKITGTIDFLSESLSQSDVLGNQAAAFAQIYLSEVKQLFGKVELVERCCDPPLNRFSRWRGTESIGFVLNSQEMFLLMRIKKDHHLSLDEVIEKFLIAYQTRRKQVPRKYISEVYEFRKSVIGLAIQLALTDLASAQQSQE